MKSFTKEELHTNLIQCGIKRGENLFIHSNMSALGIFAPGPEGLYDVLRNIVGDDATIVAPAYRITAPPDEVFDPEKSPSLGVGSFSEFLRCRRGVVRSLSPLHSHVFDGPLSVEVKERGFSSSFGNGSDFEFLTGKSFLGLFLGCNFQTAGTLVFHAQAIANNIPYREWQTTHRRMSLASPIGGEKIETERSFRYYARKSNAPKETREPVETALSKLGLIRNFELPYGRSLAFDFDLVSEALIGIFHDDPLMCVVKGAIYR